MSYVSAHAIAFTDEYLNSVWEVIFKQISQIIRGEISDSLINRKVWDKPELQSKLKKFRESIR